MAACGEMPEFTEKQELKEGIDWHAICTTTGEVAPGCELAGWPETAITGSREAVVPVGGQRRVRNHACWFFKEQK